MFSNPSSANNSTTCVNTCRNTSFKRSLNGSMMDINAAGFISGNCSAVECLMQFQKVPAILAPECISFWAQYIKILSQIIFFNNIYMYIRRRDWLSLHDCLCFHQNIQVYLCAWWRVAAMRFMTKLFIEWGFVSASLSLFFFAFLRSKARFRWRMQIARQQKIL